MAQAQAPTDGHIAGRAYINTYFHVAYTWPAALKPKVEPAPSGAKDPHAYAFPLFTASLADQPYGVVVVAEKLNVAGPHSTGIQNSGQFIDKIKNSLRPGPLIANISSAHKTSAQGLVFDELDYTQNGKPSSLLATQIDQYLIVFKCSAQSASEMASMQRSALALRRIK
ncbi:hypothetical protein DYQ86_12750 [Acidobacteria bacterium AB60]|nr:hypothetical protein DYQ86_12750 [Acidobacteria bacterium AB60]